MACCWRPDRTDFYLCFCSLPRTLLLRLHPAPPPRLTAGFPILLSPALSSTTQNTGKLEEEVGCEDPWNGELLARMIDLPFVDPTRDADEIDSWRI